MAKLSKQLCDILLNDEKAIEEITKVRDILKIRGESESAAENILTSVLMPPIKPLQLNTKKYDIKYEYKPKTIHEYFKPQTKKAEELFKIELDKSMTESLFDEQITCTSAVDEPKQLNLEELKEFIQKLPPMPKYYPEPNFEIKRDESSFNARSLMRFERPIFNDYVTIKKAIRRHKKRRINKKLNKKYGVKYITREVKRLPLMFSCSTA